ncbi:MAG: DUF4249 family protein [Bacteroidales bacterium]|nr:DUF4249 family protein [Bacteroidales bacterium]MBN2762972.1 DUF4249 family protein [Bacteroidales bacterium]
MFRKIIILAVIPACLFSCRELYDDFQPELNAEYLVVEGMITDDPGPYYVKLYKAMAYRNDMQLYEYDPEPETQAVVRIRSDKGEDVVLYELTPGTYATLQEELSGEIGHSYWLYIETLNGDIYESLPSILMEKPDVPGLYATPAEKSIVNENLPGGPQFVTQEGLQITCDVFNNSNANYVKVELRTFSPSFYFADSAFTEVANPVLLESGYRPFFYHKRDSLYCWSLRPADIKPCIAGTGSSSASSLVTGIPLGFIAMNIPYASNDTIMHYMYDGYTIHDVDAEFDSVIIQEVVIRVFYSSYYITDIKAYAINDTIYEYYRNLKIQVTAGNKIFDPVPAELTGNIRCLSDPGKNIYGIFTVASIMKRQFFIRWSGTYDLPVVEKLDDYFPVESSGCVTELPGFWRRY